jgi:hypothetical protein
MWIELKPGNLAREGWVYLTPDEAEQLLEALQEWSTNRRDDPGWHTHVTDEDRELTVAVDPSAHERFGRSS